MNILPVISKRSSCGRDHIDPYSVNYDEIITCINERTRFASLAEFIDKLGEICDSDLYEFPNNYLICVNHINDAYIAACAIFCTLDDRLEDTFGRIINIRRQDRADADPVAEMAFASMNGGEDISGMTCPEMVIVTDINRVTADDPKMSGNIPFFFVVCSENTVHPDNIPEGFTGAFCIDVRDDVSGAEILENYFYSRSLSFEGNDREIKKLAEACGSDEYSLIDAAKQVAGNCILRDPDERMIIGEDFRNVAKKSRGRLRSTGKQLVGLSGETAKIDMIIKGLCFDRIRREKGYSCTSEGCHMVFAGAPGTAKTTLARIFAGRLAEAGIIKSADHFRECYKSDLVGKYVGKTADKVDSMFREMHERGGGVLFFDEIYTLAEQDCTSYDREAVTCIIQNMENYRETVFCIFAGYENKMTMFLESNPGMKSRISNIVRFREYSNDELREIFISIAAEHGYKLEAPCTGIFGDYFSRLRSIRGDYFGNGREARNLFVNAVQKHTRNIDITRRLTKKQLTVLTAEDISAAAAEIISSEIGGSKGNVRIGF